MGSYFQNLALTFLAFAFLYSLETIIHLLTNYSFEFILTLPCSLAITYANAKISNFQIYFKWNTFTTGLHMFAAFSSAFYFFISCIYFFNRSRLIVSDGSTTPVVAVPFCLIGLAVIYSNSYLEDYFRPKRNLAQSSTVKHLRPENLSIEWAIPQSVYWSKLATLAQFFLIAFYSIVGQFNYQRFIFNLNYKDYYVIVILMLVYNYYSMSKWTWLKFERRLDNLWLANEKSQRQINISFFLSVLACSPKKFASEICTICLETSPTRHFCANHCFHEDCLIGHLITKCEQILNEAMIQSTFHQTHDENNRHTPSKDHMSYLVAIKRKHLPLCPNCNQHCEQNKINIAIEDVLTNTMTDAKIVIQE